MVSSMLSHSAAVLSVLPLTINVLSRIATIWNARMCNKRMNKRKNLTYCTHTAAFAVQLTSLAGGLPNGREGR